MPRVCPAVQLVVVAVLCLIFPLNAQAKGALVPIGSVHFILHHLSVQPPKLPASNARLQQPLFSAYRVFTKAGDKASLKFADGSIVHVNQRTDLLLRSANVTEVRRGEVAVLDGLTSHHQTTTGSAVASAVGTEFDVRIERGTTPSGYSTPTAPTFPPGTTTVSVVSGNVVVSNRYGRVTVRPGQWTHVAPGRAPTTPTRHNARADVAWTANLPSS